MQVYILAVDDSPTIRSAAKFALSQAGYDVKTAENGMDGLKKIEEIHAEGSTVAMIISDINMPVMDGITFIRTVKKTKFKSIPILVMTTESQATKKAEGKEAGAVGWLVKPFTPKQLANVVRKFVKQVAPSEKTVAEVEKTAPRGDNSSQLLDIFYDDAFILVTELELAFKRLRRTPDDEEFLGDVRLALYKIRITATFVGCNNLARLAHAIEVDALKRIQKDGDVLTEELFLILLDAIDIIESLTKPSGNRSADISGRVERFLDKLTKHFE